MAIIDLVRAGRSIDELAQALDALDHAGRVQALEPLKGKEQARLFELAAGRGCTIARDFVPSEKAPLTEVIHQGWNTLPAFRSFQKRFCRPSRAASEPVAVGYNEQAMRPVTGPGYFTAREAAGESGVPTVVIDYTRLPEERPAGWPPILPNSARLSRFIYDGTQDWMWRVSAHVTIGRARRASGWMDNWFVLCREP